MKFVLQKRVTDRISDITWIEQGVYPVVRYFDSDRVMIDIGANPVGRKRLLTIVKLKDGYFTR